MLVYLISLPFACETSFLGFELDLLTHEFLVNFVCWISTLRNPWYLFSSSIYFSHRVSCRFGSGCSNPETPDIAPDTPDHQTRSIRAYTRSIRASLCLTFLLSALNCRLPIHPPLGILRSFQEGRDGRGEAAVALGAMPSIVGPPRTTARASDAVAAHRGTGVAVALENKAAAPRAAQVRRPRGQWWPP